MINIIKSRRSTRKYKDMPVVKAQIEKILDAAMHAPSACNSRPWRFIAITNRNILNKLADAHKHAKMLHSATAAIVICALAKEQAENETAKGFYPQDCAAATQNILLAAESLGLSTCWCGVYPKEPMIKAVSEILEFSDDEIPFCVIAVGHGDETPIARGFYDSDKVRWME